MVHRLRLVSIIAVCFLTSAGLALGQGQGTSFSGSGFSNGPALGPSRSLGTIPPLRPLMGQTNADASGGLRHSARESESGRHCEGGNSPHRRYGRLYEGDGYYSTDIALGLPGYFYSAYFGGDYADSYNYVDGPYAQGGTQQNGTQSQVQTGSQNQTMNQGQGQRQTQSQGKKGQAKEQAPQKPQYLTYTPKKESLQEKAKTGKAAPVEFKSNPSHARVTVDGYFVGHTPTTVQIPLGKHLVSISKWGYDSKEQEIDVTGKKSVSVNSTLSKDW